MRFAKRGRMRFTSHRDFQRAFERALRRAHVPMAFSHGFTPHPKVSYLGASPTGAASEAEYLEVSVTQECDPEHIRSALDEALPDGFDVVDLVIAGPGALADRLQVSSWLLEMGGADVATVTDAVDGFLAAESVEVRRRTKNGTRTLDARAVLLHGDVTGDDPVAVTAVIRHESPTVRPDEIMAGLRLVAGFEPPAPPRVTRLAQGLWSNGAIDDPLAPDRVGGASAPGRRGE
ncbi:radical SAM-linked protein [Haloactinopolyspora alba]|uniref:Radical SAM-linked protein n=1 Tax=Haloactinopolyspora alba TaxID=648780 RepID=A0A2P8EBF9_9ACTN|nr:radical SAM-linked protein [Haloactinopolyspora alba]